MFRTLTIAKRVVATAEFVLETVAMIPPAAKMMMASLIEMDLALSALSVASGIYLLRYVAVLLESFQKNLIV